MILPQFWAIEPHFGTKCMFRWYRRLIKKKERARDQENKGKKIKRYKDFK